MHFNVTSDSGGLVEGYLVPDSFSSEPRLRVSEGDREVALINANVTIPSLVTAGRHETGRCGFMLDEAIVPGLAGLERLIIADADSELVVYRRAVPGVTPRKILRLETHLLPLWRLDEPLDAAFQYFARGIEKLGRETATQMFLLTSVESVYLSGRILYRSFARYIEEGFATAILLQDPYCELAERLLVLARAHKVGLETLGMRDSMSFKNAAGFAATLPLTDTRALQRALRRMPAEVASAFANPLVRQLTTNTPDEMAPSGAVASALDALAGFALVGLREDPRAFVDGLAELADVDPARLSAPPRFPSVGELAERLRETGDVDELLERDRECYHYLAQAYRSSEAAQHLATPGADIIPPR